MKLADAVSLRSRRRKLRLFLDEMRPTPETTVLDVGVDEVGFGGDGGHEGCTTHNFFEELYPWPGRITALGLHDGAGFRRSYPAVPYVQGDACALPFADGAFDVVFSNAVIEHVGDRDRQRRFVAEALRVGRRVFLTTPNRWFPVEVHTRLPLVHWLPDAVAGPRLRPRRQGLGAGRTTCSARATCAASSPATSASSTSGSRSWRSHERRQCPPRPHRARRPRRRARAPQPRHGRAVGRRHAWHLARRRRRVEGRAARGRARRRAPRRAHSPARDVGRPARAPLRGDRPPLLARSRRAGSTARRRSAASSSPPATT